MHFMIIVNNGRNGFKSMANNIKARPMYKQLPCFGRCQGWTEHIYCRSLYTTRYFDPFKKRWVNRDYDTYACQGCEREKTQEEMAKLNEHTG
jgi:hypothetical protein